MTHPLFEPLDTLANTLKDWRSAMGLTSRPDVYGRVYIARDDEETSDVDLTGVSGPAPATGHLALKLASFEQTCIESGEVVLQHLEKNAPIFQGQHNTLCISARPNARSGPHFCITWGNRTIFGVKRQMNSLDDILARIDTLVVNAQHLQPGPKLFEFNDSAEIRAQNVQDAYALFCALWYPETLENPTQKNHLNKVREIINIDTLLPTKAPI